MSGGPPGNRGPPERREMMEYEEWKEKMLNRVKEFFKQNFDEIIEEAMENSEEATPAEAAEIVAMLKLNDEISIDTYFARYGLDKIYKQGWSVNELAFEVKRTKIGYSGLEAKVAVVAPNGAEAIVDVWVRKLKASDVSKKDWERYQEIIREWKEKLEIPFLRRKIKELERKLAKKDKQIQELAERCAAAAAEAAAEDGCDLDP